VAWHGLDRAGPQTWSDAVDNLPLPWYADQKRELGAFATFLGFKVRGRPGSNAGVWRAIAVGDACLFHIRGAKLRLAFPVAHSADFGNRPDLVRSRRAAPDSSRRARGRWQPEDRFLLMTDALAQWFLLGVEEARDPISEIGALLAQPPDQAGFAAWVTECRRSSMRNDDVTLIVVDLQ
jgi:hypothetical protein